MQLYLIRHTQSENNELWHRTGSSDGRSSDPALTELGRRQARVLAEFIARDSTEDGRTTDDVLDRRGIKLTHLYCSLMRRSIETGLTLAERLDLPLVALENVHERGGLYLKDPEKNEKRGMPGPNREYFRQHFPSLVLPESLGDAGWWNRPYEQREAAVARAEKVVDWLLAVHDQTDDRVAMIIHGGFIQSLFTVIFQMPLANSGLKDGREVWIKANNGSISRIDFHSNALRLTYQNRIDFFPEDLIT